ncbi:unnamed protein product [Umbelopsis ramanniana]
MALTCSKRKRSMEDNQLPTPTKTVRFSTEKEEVIYTYSPTDYDRSGIHCVPVLYTVNPVIFESRRKLSVSIPEKDYSSVSSPTESDVSSPEYDARETFTRIKKGPKLRIDTSICQGPLFFTKLSTNPAKSSFPALDDDDNHFLVPLYS